MNRNLSENKFVFDKMLAKLIEVVVRDCQFYITAISICIFTIFSINGVMQNHIAQFSLKGDELSAWQTNLAEYMFCNSKNV